MVCVFPMVIDSILPHVDFGPNDHREDAFHFRMILRKTFTPGIYLKAVLAEYMEKSLMRNEELITVDRKLNTKSCYVELHRNSDVNNNDVFF